MLVLRRKRGQRLLIQGGITITVVRVENEADAVRIGVEAPPGVCIMREEVADKYHFRDGGERTNGAGRS